MTYQILKYKIRPGQFSRFVTFVNRCICFFTRSPFWHSAIVLNGTKHESGHPYGVKETLQYVHTPSAYTTVTEHECTEEQLAKMIDYAKLQQKQNRKYNHGKLLSLAFCYPTRKLWNWLGWVPFRWNYWGVVCSVYVREIEFSGGIDRTPELNIDLTAPRDN